MDARERRQELINRLQEESGPISATAFAREFSVSRQIIVGDIALLRAAGMDITATPRGYVLSSRPAGILVTLACSHTCAQMQEELNAMVDQGCTVVDVTVEHPIYGQITAPLRLSNRYEVRQFITRCHDEAAAPLSMLTDGVHLHTLACPDEATILRVRQALSELGILLEV